MKIAFELSPVEANLLRCLAPSNARSNDDLQRVAQELLVTSIKREVKARRIDSGKAFAIAIDASLRRRKEGVT